MVERERIIESKQSNGTSKRLKVHWQIFGSEHTNEYRQAIYIVSSIDSLIRWLLFMENVPSSSPDGPVLHS